ncbi:MAG: hypothetical protein AAF747_09980 [Planctomycetota bacterium]
MTGWRRGTTAAACVAAYVTMVLGCAPAWGQANTTDALTRALQRVIELQEENRLLTEEIGELRTQVRELEARLEQANRTIDRLVAGQGGGGAAPSSGSGSGTEHRPSTRMIADVPAEPTASPASMFNMLAKRYEEKFSEALDAGNVQPSDVEAWCEERHMTARGTIAWLVSFDKASYIRMPTRRQELYADLTVYDDATLEPIGFEVRVLVPRKLEAQVLTAGDDSYFELRGRFQQRPVFNPGRTEPGPFDVPRFIGPYAEFGYELEMDRLSPSTRSSLPAPADDGPSDDDEPMRPVIVPRTPR